MWLCALAKPFERKNPGLLLNSTVAGAIIGSKAFCARISQQKGSAGRGPFVGLAAVPVRLTQQVIEINVLEHQFLSGGDLV